MTVYVVKRTERQTPAFVAIRPVGEQPEVAKENVDVVAVCDWRWRRRSVRVLDRLLAITRRLAAPCHFTAGPGEADGEEDLALERGDKDMIGGEDWRRVSGRKRSLPDHILLHVEALGKALGWRDTRSVRPTKLCPIRR